MQTIELIGDCGIRNAATVADQLREAFTRSGAITVAVDAISAADITTVQLLISAQKEATSAGRTLRLSAPPEGALLALLQATGMLDASGAALVPEADFLAFDNPTRQEQVA